MTMLKRLDPIDLRLTAWMARYGITLTRLALGVVFLWFGIIKFVPDWSPAADLATRTIKNLVLVSAAIVIGATVRGGQSARSG